MKLKKENRLVSLIWNNCSMRNTPADYKKLETACEVYLNDLFKTIIYNAEIADENWVLIKEQYLINKLGLQRSASK